MVGDDWLTLPEQLAISAAGWAGKKAIKWGYQKWQNRSKSPGRIHGRKITMARFSRRRYSRRRYSRRRFSRRRRYRRRVRRSSGRTRTETKFVGITVKAGNAFLPLNFDNHLITGLSDYKAAFTEFRILSCTLYMTEGDPKTTAPSGFTDSWLLAPSRAVAKARGLATGITIASSAGFLNQMVLSPDDATQLAGVKYLIPNTTTTKMHVSFCPFRMSWGINSLDTPVGSSISDISVVGRPVSCRRWMPISWLYPLNTSSTQRPLNMFGPYLIPLNNNETTADIVSGIMRVRYQVRGQI